MYRLLQQIILNGEMQFPSAENCTIEELLKKLVNKVFTDPIGEAESIVVVGDRFLLGGDYEEAVKIYTRGLQGCPPVCKLSVKLYIQRAKALERLELYEESLCDINRAAELPVPDEVLKTLDKKKIELQEKASRAKRDSENKQRTTRNYFTEMPVLADGENENVPGTSNSIRLIYDRKSGRHFVAIKPIKQGDVILIEKPIVVLPEDDVTTCSGMPCRNCLKCTHAPIPCENCTSALYCSVECREEAYKMVHKFECELKFSINDDGLLLAFILLCKITDNGAKLEEAIKYCTEMDSMTHDSKNNLCSPENLLGKDMKAILNTSLSMKNEPDMKMARVAVISAERLRNTSNLMRGNNDLLGLSRLMYRLFYICKANSVMIHNSKDCQSIAMGIYHLLCMIEHSCSPNTLYSFHEQNVLALHAAKDIKPGEKITFNFIYESALVGPTNNRQALIQKMGRNPCKCDACMYNYTFKPELHGKIDVPMRLKRRLRKCPTDVDGMWQLLKIINDEIKRPCVELEVLKIGLSHAYMGHEYPAIWLLYHGVVGF